MPIEPTAQRSYGFACDTNARVGIRAGNECILQVLDLVNGSPTHMFDTNYSSSGRLAMSADGSRCLTGGWANPNGGGVCCYSVSDGTLLWRRRDLNRPQAVLRDDRNDGWVVSLDRGGTHLLDGLSGQSLGKIRGAGFGSHVTHITECDAYLCIRKNRMELLHTHDLKPALQFRVPTIWNHLEPEPRVPRGLGLTHRSLERTSDPLCEQGDRIGALCAAHGNGRLVVSINSGPLLCFSLATGDLEWSLESPIGCHHLKVGVSTSRRTCYALQWSRTQGGSEELLAVDLANGSVIAQHSVPGWGWSSGQFVRDAAAVVCGGGALETSTGKTRAFT